MSGLILTGWTPKRQNTLLGFATVQLDNSLEIRDIPVHRTSGKVWCALPSKPIVARDGTPLLDTRGKPRYSPILEFRDKVKAAAFTAAVIKAVERAHPADMTDDGGAA